MDWKKLSGSQIGALVGFVIGLILALILLYFTRNPNLNSLVFFLIVIFLFTMLGFLLGFMVNVSNNWDKIVLWKKGALLGIAINSCLTIPFLILGLSDNLGTLLGYLFSISHFLPYFIASDLLHICGGENCTGFILLSIFWIPLFGFLMGTLIGFVMGKIKSKK